MADNETSEYTVEIGGLEHTVLLSEEDAKRYPDAKPVAAKSVKPANKAAAPANKGASEK